MGWIGADLGALDTLARRFERTSEACDRHARAVMDSATTTVEHFTTAMTALDRDAGQLAAHIGTAITTVRAQADDTAWSGVNRSRQDEQLATYEADVVGLQQAIDGFLADAAAIVGGSLNPVLTGMRTDLERTGAAAAAAAAGFAQHVDGQRRSLDAVLNGAW